MPRGRPPLGLGVSPRATLRSFILLVSYERYFLVIRDMRRRGFRGVSAGEKEGFPRGFRGFPGVSIRDTLESRVLIIWEFRCFVAWPKPKNPGEQAPFIILN